MLLQQLMMVLMMLIMMMMTTKTVLLYAAYHTRVLTAALQRRGCEPVRRRLASATRRLHGWAQVAGLPIEMTCIDTTAGNASTRRSPGRGDSGRESNVRPGAQLGPATSPIKPRLGGVRAEEAVFRRSALPAALERPPTNPATVGHGLCGRCWHCCVPCTTG